MSPLAPEDWADRHEQLLQDVLDVWPQVDRGSLEDIDGDYDGMVRVVSRDTNLDETVIRQRLATVEPREREQTTDQGQASLAQLRLAGFSDEERQRIVDRLAKLDRRLRRFPSEGTDLELMVKDRGTTGQSVTMEVHLPRFGKYVATSTNADLMAALADIREDLIRQIGEAVDRRVDGRTPSR